MIKSFSIVEGCIQYDIILLVLPIMQLLTVGHSLFRGMAECTYHLEPLMATLPAILVMNALILMGSQVYSIVELMDCGYSLHQPARVTCLNVPAMLIVMCIFSYQ